MVLQYTYILIHNNELVDWFGLNAFFNELSTISRGPVHLHVHMCYQHILLAHCWRTVIFVKRRKECWPNWDLNSQTLYWQPASLPPELPGLDPYLCKVWRDLKVLNSRWRSTIWNVETSANIANCDKNTYFGSIVNWNSMTMYTVWLIWYVYPWKMKQNQSIFRCILYRKNK